MKGYTFDGEYAAIPEHTQKLLLDWVMKGRSGGDFLNTLIVGDLYGAFAHADDQNLRAMHIIVKWMWNRAPVDCITRPAFVDAWIKARQWKGLDDK